MDDNGFRKYDFFLEGPTDKAVLLIHGITGTPSEMRYLGRCLNKAGYSVLCNTLPRHCSSLSELKKVTWQEIADFCAEDLSKLKCRYEKIFVGGISMGALMSVHLACLYAEKINGLCALATTMFYDGWALPRRKILLNVVWHVPVLRNTINIREDWPYGLKDESLRQDIERFYKNASANTFDKKTLLFGSPFFPLANLYQHHLFSRVAKRELPAVKTPIIIIHAQEDDMAGLKNARYLFDNIGSPKKSLIVLEDSYHMITIDRQKDKVASEVINFFNQL